MSIDLLGRHKAIKNPQDLEPCGLIGRYRMSIDVCLVREGGIEQCPHHLVITVNCCLSSFLLPVIFYPLRGAVRPFVALLSIPGPAFPAK